MKVCEACGQTFSCGASNKAGACWCAALPPIEKLPKSFKDCLCEKCLRSLVSLEQVKLKVDLAPLVEGEDFYFNDQGLSVFTEKYHLKRGFCCDSGCKHCPWSTRG